MPYELHIPLPEGSAPPEVEAALADALAAAGPVERAAFGLAWTVEGTRIEVHRSDADAEGRGAGFSVQIPLGAIESEVDQAIEKLLALLPERGLSAFDPQVGAVLGPKDGGRALAAWRDASRYALEYGGQVEDPRGGLAKATEAEHVAPKGLSTGTKVFLAVLALLAGAYLLFRFFVLDTLAEQLAAEPAERVPEGPPPGWIHTHPPRPPPESGAEGSGARRSAASPEH